MKKILLTALTIKNVIFWSTLVAGLLVSLSSNAYLSIMGEPVTGGDTLGLVLTSTTFPILGPILQELNVPESELTTYLHSQATMIHNGNSINTGNLIAALAQSCGLSEKNVAERILSIYSNGEQVTGAACDILKIDL